MIFETESGDSHGPQDPHADSVRPVGGLTGGGSPVSGPTPAAGGSPRQACFSRCADIWLPASHVSERMAAVIEGAWMEEMGSQGPVSCLDQLSI